MINLSGTINTSFKISKPKAFRGTSRKLARRLTKVFFCLFVGLKWTSILVHCGAGVSRVITHYNLVGYLRHRISHQIPQNELPRGPKIHQSQETRNLPKPRLLITVEKVCRGSLATREHPNHLKRLLQTLSKFNIPKFPTRTLTKK